MRGDDVLRVLVVCAANQCRSRAAEALLIDALRDHPAIEVRSAGVDVRAPLPMCSIAERYLTDLGHDVRDYAALPAQPATFSLLSTSDLILVADAQVRSGITAIDPQARRRTFTMPGAAAAAQVLDEQSVIARAVAAHHAGETEVLELVAGEQHTVAGALEPGNARAAAAWLATEIEAAQGTARHTGSWDITDAHGAPRDIHVHTLADVSKAMYPIWRQLRLLDAVIRGKSL